LLLSPQRHCERSEAIQKCIRGGSLDCFAALAMTELRGPEHADTQRHDDIVLLFCPTSQTSSQRALKPFRAKFPNDLYCAWGCFRIFCLEAGYSADFSLSRCA
jgi:hypothetical protein